MKAGSVRLITSCLQACERSGFLSNPQPRIVFILFKKKEKKERKKYLFILACFLAEAKDLFQCVQRIRQDGRVKVNPCVKRSRESVTAVTRAFFRNRPILMIPWTGVTPEVSLKGSSCRSQVCPRLRQRASSAQQVRLWVPPSLSPCRASSDSFIQMQKAFQSSQSF